MARPPPAERTAPERSDDQPSAVDEHPVGSFHRVLALNEDRRLAVPDHVDAGALRVGHVHRAVGSRRQIVQEGRAFDRHPLRDPPGGDLDADHLIDIRHPQRAAGAAQALRAVESGHPLQVDGTAVRREPGDVAVAVLVGHLAVDRRHEDRAGRGVVIRALRGVEVVHRPDGRRRGRRRRRLGEGPSRGEGERTNSDRPCHRHGCAASRFKRS